MSEVSDLARLLKRTQAAVKSHVTQNESGACNLYTSGPGNASIDGTPQYLGEFRQQLDDFNQAWVPAGRWAIT